MTTDQCPRSIPARIAYRMPRYSIRSHLWAEEFLLALHWPTAGAFGFLTFTQCAERPHYYEQKENGPSFGPRALFALKFSAKLSRASPAAA
jgi:hypothetical protein